MVFADTVDLYFVNLSIVKITLYSSNACRYVPVNVHKHTGQHVRTSLHSSLKKNMQSTRLR